MLNGADASAIVINPKGAARVLLVCEHASNYIPARYNGLGMTDAAKISHAAWDPGAQAVTERMGKILNARVVLGAVSRLVYDCNRPPTSTEAIRSISEQIIIPGNACLSALDQIERVETIYEPFTQVLDNTIKSMTSAPILVTVHSFTRTYNGDTRDIDIGIIHDEDAHLARTMVGLSNGDMGLKFALNEPYSRDDEVTHTLHLHGTENGLVNVMIEVCNDLLETPAQQDKIAQMLADLLAASLNEMNEDISVAGTA
jgi:predicted N-formylglutamate amidohydrolase